MAVEITRPGKNSLVLESPVMPAAGIFGYGDAYQNLIDFEKLGALVTNPVTYHPWNPAAGTRVIPLDAGVLVHTGLPNPGIRKVLDKYSGFWNKLPLPIVLHVVANTPDEMRKCAELVDAEGAVDALEIGINDETDWRDAETLVQTAVEHTEKPLLVRLPMQDAPLLAEAVENAGAGGLVICAPPRGTARDPHTGRLVGGRLYGPMVKPLVLRLVGQIVRRAQIPIVGAGGIHSPQDARDYLEAGARAVQVDSVTWVQPQMLEIIARDLGGLVLTRASGAFGDEWHPGIGKTAIEQREKERQQFDPKDSSDE